METLTKYMNVYKELSQISFSRTKEDYFKTEFFDKPKHQELFVKKMCSCSKEQVYPTRLEKPIYYFSTTKLMRTDYIYWCSFCGYYLLQDQIETYFSEELTAINQWK